MTIRSTPAGLFLLLVALGCGGAKNATSTAGSTSAGTGGGSGSTSATGGGATTGSGSGTGGAAPDLACQNSPCLNVINNCPFPIWVHAKSNGGTTLMPDNAKLGAAGQAGHAKQYDVPADWPAARVNAYWVDPGGPSPDPQAYEKVELTVGGGKMNYNITYVDYVGLPSQMEAVGPSCQKTGTFDPRVACAVPVAGLLAGCPAGLLDGKRCLSAGLYCSKAASAGTPFCHALDAAIATCAAQHPATCGVASQLNDTTANVYGCSSYFDSQPPSCSPATATCHQEGNKWCAALNRGTLAQPDGTDPTKFYQAAPYNTYAKWVHDTCPGIYAFPYDDYPSGAGQSGFRSCQADRLDITFCPGG